MPPQRRTEFVSINVTPEARDALRSAALDLTAPAGRRVSMSDVIVTALRIAEQHQQEWANLLNPGASQPPEPASDG